MNKNIIYHADEHAQKTALSQEEIAFLMNLQKEMNTQDHLATADPRYWVIRDYKRRYGKELKSVDGYCFYDKCHNTKIAEAESLSDALDEAKEYFIENHADCFTIGDFDTEDETDTNVITDLFINALRKYGFDGIELLEYEEIAVDSQIFFSHKAAEEYLEKFHYHYTSKAHTYCDCALYNDEMTQLVNILHKADFSLLAK